MVHQLKILYFIDDKYVSQTDYICEYLSSFSKEKISQCMQLVYFQIYCIYFEQDRDPMVKKLLHVDETGRQFIFIEDYSLKVFLQIFGYRQACVLMQMEFV